MPFKFKLSYDRRSVAQSALVSGHHLGPVTNFSFSSMVIIFRYLQFCYCGAPYLMRGWVCNLLEHLLLGIATAVTLRSISSRTHDHNLLSHLRLNSLLVTPYDLHCHACAWMNKQLCSIHSCDFLYHLVISRQMKARLYCEEKSINCISSSSRLSSWILATISWYTNMWKHTRGHCSSIIDRILLWRGWVTAIPQ
jgi:hypothetical protein